MASNEQNKVLSMPVRPNGVRVKPVGDLSREYITVDGYSTYQQRILGPTVDEVEIEVDLSTYDRMENDATIAKAKRIIITQVLADELQFAPGATEDEVGAEEYETYVEVMEFCQRVIGGLERPFRETLEQILGNGIRHGHGIAEIEWEYRLDGTSTKPADVRTPRANKSRFTAMFEKFGFFSAEKYEDTSNGSGAIQRPALKAQETRLMPKSIKVKPRGAAQFVVDEYLNILGMVPRNRNSLNGLNWDEVVRRDKFMVLTMNKQDEDPRGRSSYRPAFNWFNLKSQVPAEMLRFILEESVPKAVGTLPPDSPPFEFERDENDNIIYETDPVTGDLTSTPKMLTAAESMGRQIKSFRSGSGAVIPHGAKLEPFKKNSNDADFFQKVLKVIDDQMENAILLQVLAQSEGQHQARSAAQQVAELLHSLVFWIRWLLAVMTTSDILETAVRLNLGEWALRYMPYVSLGDFVRRDWAQDLEVIAKAYFQGFIDDSQRAELMAWLNMPRPGPSRQELMQDAIAEPDMNGEPVKPNRSRPDKQDGNKNRNAGNGTEKKQNGNNKNNTNSINGFSPLNILGHHGRGTFRSARALFYGRK